MITRFKLDVPVLTETKKKEKVTEDNGVGKGRRTAAGISIFTKKIVEIEVKGHELVVLGVYAPSQNEKTRMKNKFYDDLTNLLHTIGTWKIVILLVLSCPDGS